MNPFYRIAGRAADHTIGLPFAAAYYEVQPDIAVSRWERRRDHPGAVQHARPVLANADFRQPSAKLIDAGRYPWFPRTYC